MCLLVAREAHRGAAAKKARNERRETLSSISIVGKPYHKNGVIGDADTLRKNKPLNIKNASVSRDDLGIRLRSARVLGRGRACRAGKRAIRDRGRHSSP